MQCAHCGNGCEHCLQEECRDANVEQDVVEPGDRVFVDVQGTRLPESHRGHKQHGPVEKQLYRVFSKVTYAF